MIMESTRIKAREDKARKQIEMLGSLLNSDNTINLEHMTVEIGGKDYYIDLILSNYDGMTLEDVESIVKAFEDGRLTFDKIMEELADANEQDREDAAES